MTAAKKTAAAKNYGYLQNKEGRVFVATPALLKQLKKGKFGLMRITKSLYDAAIKSKSGLTEAVPDFEDESKDEL